MLNDCYYRNIAIKNKKNPGQLTGIKQLNYEEVLLRNQLIRH